MRGTGPDLVADQDDVLLRQGQPLKRVTDLDRVERHVRAARDRDRVLARRVDKDDRDTGRLGFELEEPRQVDPLDLEGRASLRPKASLPTAPTNTTAAPSRAAATAWLPPLPP